MLVFVLSRLRRTILLSHLHQIFFFALVLAGSCVLLPLLLVSATFESRFLRTFFFVFHPCRLHKLLLMGTFIQMPLLLFQSLRPQLHPLWRLQLILHLVTLRSFLFSWFLVISCSSSWFCFRAFFATASFFVSSRILYTSRHFETPSRAWGFCLPSVIVAYLEDPFWKSLS